MRILLSSLELLATAGVLRGSADDLGRASTALTGAALPEMPPAIAGEVTRGVRRSAQDVQRLADGLDGHATDLQRRANLVAVDLASIWKPVLPPLLPLSSFGGEQEDEKSFGDKALDFLFRDDVNTVKDGDAPFWERAVAAAGLIPIPVGKGIKGASVVAKGVTGGRKAGKAAERVAPGARAAPRAGDLSRLSLKELESHANNRSLELQRMLPEGSRGRVTMSAGVVEDASGRRIRVVATSEPNGYLRPGVKLNEGEMLVDSGRKHAEQNITDWARERGYKVITVGAGRSHCEPCVEAIERAGGTTASPRR